MSGQKLTTLEYLQRMNDLNLRYNYRHLQETVTKLEYLSGYSLDQLIELFAAGWTLQQPKEPYKFSDLLRAFED